MQWRPNWNIGHKNLLRFCGDSLMSQDPDCVELITPDGIAKLNPKDYVVKDSKGRFRRYSSVDFHALHETAKLKMVTQAERILVLEREVDKLQKIVYGGNEDDK